jgi:hypothetical protein
MINIHYIKLVLSAILMFGLCLNGLQAQEAVLSSGGNGYGRGGSVSFSIGQVVYTTNTDITGTVSQGVQQPFEFYVLSGTDQTNDISLDCSVYPNPTSDFVVLKLDFSFLTEMQFMSYEVYDIYARPLLNNLITEGETTIAMNNLPAATYFLKVTDNKQVKIFKVIKY